MKRTSSRLWFACAITFLFVSASAHAVIYQAESFNNASDTTAGNSGGACTNNVNVNVDIQGTTDTGGGCNVGWIAQGEWLAFNGLNVPTTGSYTIRLRVASPSGATASVDLNAGAIQLGNFAIPATGGWQNWTTVSRTVTLNAGTYNLGVFAQTAGWNFNWIEVVSAGGRPDPDLERRLQQHQYRHLESRGRRRRLGQQRTRVLHGRQQRLHPVRFAGRQQRAGAGSPS